MQTIGSKSINTLISFLREELSVYAGDGDNKRILINPGLKLTHVGSKRNSGSGLSYTVDTVYAGKNGLLIKCTREPDVSIIITSEDLKEFERT